MSIFGIFYNARSPNMAMSRDPRSKFGKKFIFFLILHLILGKVTKFLVEKLSTSEVISQKPHRGGGVENTPSAFRVKIRSKCTIFDNPVSTLLMLFSHLDQKWDRSFTFTRDLDRSRSVPEALSQVDPLRTG